MTKQEWETKILKQARGLHRWFQHLVETDSKLLGEMRAAYEDWEAGYLEGSLGVQIAFHQAQAAALAAHLADLKSKSGKG